MRKATFIGGGSFGTALSIVLSRKKDLDVVIWDRNKDVIQDINLNHKNSKYLNKITLGENIRGELDLGKALKDSEYVILSLPSHLIREYSKRISKLVREDTILISIAKGLEEGTLKRMSQIIEEEIPYNPVVILSGPSHAEEVSIGTPTAIVACSKQREKAEEVQNLFMDDKLRVYTNDDIIGVELGGAVKNIIALAAGILDGAGYGDNAKAALMTRGMSEIIRIGTKLGGDIKTFYGLTGMGDLIVTCTSLHSRNRRAGILIGRGLSMKEACSEVSMVVEGIRACKSIYELKEKIGVTMPITEALYNVLYKNWDVKESIKDLMTRDKKDEIIDF
ncbi:NAD(P)H-dependent glycerol-3-phosphate dehydrogenase [Hathewaya histolytica]|uniref:Glycerol-3-phosphate dehydrogenase [NAD(P)+] n=1 Tax=Hathewaya histolytica TaxID=1498 RepID=A0A4U9RGC4_HATHI|nr:NAD(P)H-dependent glycerol-3-phosphate dehydrogenase [Hathewaya histolytica]VTQ90228.1 glycerol-3-phosphate dehydrogenase [Hathewaya histolytica]